MDEGYSVDIVYVDFSKGFYRVPRAFLITKKIGEMWTIQSQYDR